MSSTDPLTKVSTQSLIPENKPNFETVAKRMIADDETDAMVVYILVDTVVSPSTHALDAWEPESIWLTLERRGFSIPRVNRDKVMAVIALRSRPTTTFTDVVAYTNIVVALNDETPQIDIDEQVSVDYLSWSTVWMQAHKFTVFLDYGPLEFVARNLQEEGFFLTPKALSFAQKRLSAINHNTEMEQEVGQALEECRAVDLCENPVVQAQLQKQKDVLTYLNHMFQKQAAQMAEVAKFYDL